MLGYCGERWRGFKTQLTLDYIKHHKEPPPYEVYSFINQATWEKFVESRRTPKFLAKSRKGRENQARSVYPHRLSREEYQRIEKN